MSPKFCFLVILGLIALIDNSESVKCYGCNSISDGENCHQGVNQREENCPLQKYCAKVTGNIGVIKITLRGCSTTPECDEQSTDLLTDVVCKSCEKDLCNGSGLLKSTIFGSVLVISIGALVSNKFL